MKDKDTNGEGCEKGIRFVEKMLGLLFDAMLFEHFLGVDTNC